MDNPIKYSDLVQPDSAITDLIKQLQDLSAQYSASIASVKQEAQQLSNSLKNVNSATEQGRQATREAASEAEKLRKAHKDLANAEDGTNKELIRLRQATQEANKMTKLQTQLANSAKGSYNELSAQYSINKIRLNQMSAEMRKNTQEGQKLERETKKIYEEMKRLQEATGKHQLNVGNYYNDMQKAFGGLSTQLTSIIGLNGQVGSSLMALGANAGGTTTIIGGLSAGFSALGSTLMGLLKNPVFLAMAGIAGAGFGLKAWYDYNAGLVEATRLTREFAGVTGEELVNLRTYITAIADTWGHDFKETMQAVDAVAANFKISFQEAADAIKDGFVAGADLNGDFLAKLKQYPAYFKEAGLSVRQFVAILTQTRSGIFGDQGLDAIKQANARIRQMTDATRKSLQDLGMDVNQLQKDMESGAITTFDVLQMVSAKLSELPETSQLVGETLVNVFGKQGRDAGLEMIKSLQDIDTNLDNVKKKTGEFGELEEKQMLAQQELQKALATLFDQTNGSFENMTSAVKIFATKALTSLVNGIIDAVNWFVKLYNSSKEVRAGFMLFAESITLAFKVVGNVLSGLVESIKGTANVIGGLLSMDFDQILKGAKQVAEGSARMAIQNIEAVWNYGKNLATWKDDKRLTPLGQSNTAGGGTGGGIRGGREEKKEETKTTTTTTTTDTTTKTPTNVAKDTNNTYKYTPSKTTKKQLDTRTKDEEAAYRKSLKIQRDAEDAKLKVEHEGFDLRRQQLILEYKRMQEDLEHQLKVENKILTTEDKNNIRDRITSLAKLKEQELAKLTEDEEAYNEKLRQQKARAQIAELEQTKKAIELRLKSVEKGSKEEFELRRDLISAEQELALAQNRMNGNAQNEADIVAQYDKQLADLEDAYTQHQLEMYDKQRELADSEFDLLENSEKKKTEYRLKAEKARLEKVLELNEKMNDKMSDIEVQTIKNQIKKIDQELESNNYNRDIYDFMGLNLSDEKKQAIDTSLQYAQEAVQTFMQSYVQAAETKAKLAEKAVDDAQAVLEAEIQARNEGYASNVEMAQKELDNAKRMQQKAQKQAIQAQKQQLLLDAATQTSSLITASANIWKSFSGAGPWGIAAAIAAIATMWSSFAYSKIKAVQMVGKNSEQYGEGTVELLEGGSHQSGNDIDLGTKKDGTKRRAEGGEFFAVINKRNSRRYRKVIPDVIHSLNDGTFASKYLNAYKTDEGMIFNINGSSDELKDLSADVRAIKKQNERRTYVDGRGNMVITYNNVKRTIRV